MEQAPERSGSLDHAGLATLIGVMAAPSPAAHVRAVLAYHRSRGVRFDLAWASALRSVPRGGADLSEWRSALRWCRERFRAAYEREPFSGRLSVPDAEADQVAV
jgi:hypothetical protein